MSDGRKRGGWHCQSDWYELVVVVYVALGFRPCYSLPVLAASITEAKKIEWDRRLGKIAPTCYP